MGRIFLDDGARMGKADNAVGEFAFEFANRLIGLFDETAYNLARIGHFLQSDDRFALQTICRATQNVCRVRTDLCNCIRNVSGIRLESRNQR